MTLATAHPAKFPDAVVRATGVHPALPAHLADLFERPERTQVVANDLATVAGPRPGAGAPAQRRPDATSRHPVPATLRAVGDRSVR